MIMQLTNLIDNYRFLLPIPDMNAYFELEISRNFKTNRKDDAVIDPKRDNVCAIAVLVDELSREDAVSTEITLQFVGNTKHR